MQVSIQKEIKKTYPKRNDVQFRVSRRLFVAFFILQTLCSLLLCFITSLLTDLALNTLMD